MIDWDNLRMFLELSRSQGLVDAAKKLGVDHSTVSRRMKRLEEQVGTQLFERNNAGYLLTPEGHRLVEYAEGIESMIYTATEEVGEHNRLLSGQVRLGATEGFGSFVLAPHIANFCARHPHMTIDLIAVPRLVALSKREADLAVTIERPQSGPYVVTKLADYRLKLYGTQSYLEGHAPIAAISDLAGHSLIGYVDDLIFSTELRYIENVAPNAFRAMRSTSITAQYHAARQGHALAILPCFMAQQCDELVSVLDEEIELVRTFWLVSPTERKNVARVTALWNYIREISELNSAFLMGESSQIRWVR